MAKAVLNRSALGNITDLTTPTATQQYSLGYRVSIKNDDYTTPQDFVYTKIHAALTQYVPYVLRKASTSGAEVVTAAPTTMAAPGELVCVPQVAFTTSASYGFVQVAGNTTVVVTASTAAIAGYGYALTNGAAALTVSTSATQLVSTCAFLVTTTTGASASVMLIGEPVVITT